MAGLVWRLTTDEFRQLVARSVTFTEIIRSCGYRNVGGGYRMIKKRIVAEHVDDSHITKGLGANKGKVYRTFDPIPFDQVFIENSKYSQTVIRRYVLRYKLIENKCSICGQLPTWLNKPLTLTLDHINGVNTDHRLTNLRFLCPNCNSQTSTYGGRNIRKYGSDPAG